MSVEALPGTITKSKLVEMGMDPDLKDFMIVGFRDRGSVMVGWSDGLRNGDLAFGLKCLEIDVTDHLR